MLVMVVSVKVKPGRRDDFLQAIREDVESTTEKEEGNFQFIVVEDSADPNSFFFVEVYRDQAALDAHRKTPHFMKYRAATTDLYEGEPVRRVGTNIFPDDAYWTG